MKCNTDGSVTLYFRNKSPGRDKEANWRPAPKGELTLGGGQAGARAR
jgi:hypothetical protein